MVGCPAQKGVMRMVGWSRGAEAQRVLCEASRYRSGGETNVLRAGDGGLGKYFEETVNPLRFYLTRIRSLPYYTGQRQNFARRDTG